MSSVWNRSIKLSIFGESHGAGIGVVIDNLPPGEKIDMELVLAFMARRAPGSKAGSTARKESDKPEILSGMLNGHTTGAPLCAVIRSHNIQSGDYDNISSLARPGHADVAGYIRFNGANDVRGGGHFSGRLTAPMVFAGAICQQILERRSVYCGAHLLSVHGISDIGFNTVAPTFEEITVVRKKDFPVLDDLRGERIKNEIEKARLNLDSVGGVVECIAVGVPAGIGSPIFEGVENDIASIIFGIPAVRGLEFGMGFSASECYGSEHNDEFYMENSEIKTRTNNHAGILGGITTGMPIHFKVAFKPTPSIAKEQKTIDYRSLSDSILEIKGRHDSCLAVRAVPVVEATANIAILSQMIQHGKV